MHRPSRYSQHLEVLLALITYLGLTGWRSRAPNGLSRDLGLDEASISVVLAGFPGLFRKGSIYDTAAGPQNSYTLHARYALRRPRSRQAGSNADADGFDGRPTSRSDPRAEQDGRGEELDAETLRALLDFVSEQARVERDSRYQRMSQLWVVVGVGVAAVASVIAAFIQASAG